MSDLSSFAMLPRDLPVPTNDGACDHLTQLALPEVVLQATTGQELPLKSLQGKTILYCFPMTGTPGTPLPVGWNSIPGARGCTPQACKFRDHARDLHSHGITTLLGISTQSVKALEEVRDRLHLPFELLSDSALELTNALKLPTFTIDDQVYIKRLTLYAEAGIIEKVWYPVFPPDQHAQEVLEWLKDPHEPASSDEASAAGAR